MMATPAELDEIEYYLLLAEFDLLWSRRPLPGDRQRMDQMMRLIEAFEAMRRIASSA
ncbi:MULTISPECIES: hypothetical protein [unclassified Herbaspirillum]|uniref:hypothetical protein n=1 Tax=unclassified Herbaspirillum TaxID=2624150 RepID=UPI00116BF9B3|nr:MULTISPECIES: hypothetical protein [unclassified Herbaspirillum]MBB5391757.1 hypothetical protein [Herbaspirillum sp. SJZ102]TQK02997.1 hypothetical protein FB599_3664 [Herbaspirillum sp. SJZ130]TQK06615.1 hypothetical protein FB598_3621 [Herbaspirillum sp. SJZ106]TWC71132.1 hypothetical protein FB597_101102 [Herbaspirillum sp. SJZ099]